MDAAMVVAVGDHGRGYGRRVGRDVAVAVANAVAMAVLVALMDAMAVGVNVSAGVAALAARDRDARLGRTAAVETADASPATGQGARARRDQRGLGERRGREHATRGRARLQAQTCSPCLGQSSSDELAMRLQGKWLRRSPPLRTSSR